jgi:hypothetical protein
MSLLRLCQDLPMLKASTPDFQGDSLIVSESLRRSRSPSLDDADPRPPPFQRSCFFTGITKGAFNSIDFPSQGLSH